MFDSPIISGDVLREVIAKAPRNLDNLDAELLFIDRNYIFHYLEGNRHVYFLGRQLWEKTMKNEVYRLRVE